MSSSARMALASSTARESAQPARPERPTENQIAALAYQLWVAKGCPLGTNREDWLLAEALLNAAFAAIRQELSTGAGTAERDSWVEEAAAVEFEWDGHWEVWEREWGGARWVRDPRHAA